MVNQVQFEWQRVAGYLKEVSLCSLILGTLSYVIARTNPDLVDLIFPKATEESRRAWFYFLAMYLTVIPVYSVKVSRTLSKHVVPAHSLPKKIAGTIAALGLLPLLVCAGPGVLMFGADAVGRGHLAYLLRSQSFLEIVSLGAFFSYAAVLGSWMLFVALPSMWKTSNFNPRIGS